ncbi:MAG: FAD-dependent oxidoreductase [Polyangiales bacterium]
MLSHDELLKLPLFASLGPDELDYLASTVPDIHVAPGDYVVHEGEGRALVVVVEGRLEVIKVIDGVERVIGYRVPGTLFGEVPIVLNSPFLASLRAVETSRVIRVEPKVFHTLAAAAPQISATLGAAAIERIGGLQNLAKAPTRPDLIVIGPRFVPEVQALRTFLHRNHIEFEWRAQEDEADRYPIVKLPDGKVFVEPSVQALAKAVGLSIAPSREDYDVVIIGGGPAGMAAAVYGASEGLRTMLVEREAPGGQAGTSSRIENYLGFPFGVSGDDLATRALEQARRLGAEIVVTRAVERMDLSTSMLTLDGGAALKARTLVLATGVAWRRLAIESIDRFTGRGVFYGAARSEATATQGRDVFLIGAGNSAGQAALFFANHAHTVTLVVRGDALGKSMSHYLIQQLQTKPNVRVELRSEVVGLHGGEQLEEIDVIDHRTGTTRRVPAGGLFVFIGADASTDWLPAEIARDANGYVLTGLDAARTGRWTGAREPFLLETTAPGVFAVGDVRSGSVKRVASAVGDGSLAITFVRQHLDALARG